MSEWGDGEPQLVPGFLRGYRAWRPCMGTLMSVGVLHGWGSNRQTAQCKARLGVHLGPDLGPALDQSLSAPVRGCTCGFYGSYRTVPPEYRRCEVWGSFRATGRIILGDRGFKCQYAELESMYINPNPRRRPPMLAAPANYQGIERNYSKIPTYDSWEDLQRAHPPSDISELVPQVRAEMDPVAEINAAMAGMFNALTITLNNLSKMLPSQLFPSVTDEDKEKGK